MSGLGKYVRQARLYGPDEVFETARLDRLSPVDLGYLNLELRGLGWRPSQKQVAWQVVDLVEDGQPDGEIVRLVGCDPKTVRRWRAETRPESERWKAIGAMYDGSPVSGLDQLEAALDHLEERGQVREMTRKAAFQSGESREIRPIRHRWSDAVKFPSEGVLERAA